MKRLQAKGAKTLPSRVALTDLNNSQRQLTDYAKASPIKAESEGTDEMSGVMRTIAKGKRW